MKNVSFLSEHFQFLEVEFSIYLNRRVFVMDIKVSFCSICFLICLLSEFDLEVGTAQ